MRNIGDGIFWLIAIVGIGGSGSLLAFTVYHGLTEVDDKGKRQGLWVALGICVVFVFAYGRASASG